MKILFTSCTQKDPEEFKNTPLGKSIAALKLDSLIVYNNTSGMPEMYNKTINSIGPDVDAIVFVHDDVYINDWMVCDKLEEAFKKFDVIGVAGSASFSAKGPMVAWHASPQSDWSGGCLHVETDKNERSINDVYYTQFGKYNRNCAVIDGLFIAAHRRVFDAGVRFREEFKFDFYDASFCIECYYKGKRIGTAPIMITHLSHGAGIMKKSYMDSQEIFKKIYLKEGKNNEAKT